VLRIWIARPRTIRDPAVLDHLRALLSPDERARLQKRPRATAKQFLVTRGLVRWALSQFAPGVAPTAWDFATGTHGKPCVAGPSSAPRISFNLSHSGELIACAVAPVGQRVGVDVEDLARDRRFDRLADRFFAPSEAARVRSAVAADKPLCFYRYWTLKESYIKARGLGMALPLSAFWFDLSRDITPRPPRIVFDERIDDDPESWSFSQQQLDDRHLLALALRGRGSVPPTPVASGAGGASPDWGLWPSSHPGPRRCWGPAG